MFTHADIAPHNVVSFDMGPNGPLFRSDTIARGGMTDVIGVRELGPGTYPFWCTIHPTMTGLLTVAAPVGPAPVVVGAIPAPTSLALSGDRLYVTSAQRGAVLSAQILDGGALGPLTEHTTGLDAPMGLAFGFDGTLFVSDSYPSTRPGRVRDGRVWAIPPGGGAASAVGQIVISGLPNGLHATSGLAVHAGRLFIANGSSTDDGTGTPVDEPLSGTLLSVPVTARGLTPADLTPEPDPRFPPPVEPALLLEARGLRGVADIAFRPGTAEAWLSNTGPDGLDPWGEDLLNRAYSDLPPPDFGFPACLYRKGADSPDVTQNPVVASTHPCTTASRAPEVTLGLHVGASGLAFGPPEAPWDGDLFVAERGPSAGLHAAGRKVVRVPVDGSGQAQAPQELLPGVAPTDLAFGPDGLYVADAGGAILLLRTFG